MEERLAAGEYQSRAFAAAPCVAAAASAEEEPALALAASTKPARVVCWVRVGNDFTCTTSSKAEGRAGSKASSLEVSGSVGTGRRRRTRERARANRGDMGSPEKGVGRKVKDEGQIMN